MTINAAILATGTAADLGLLHSPSNEMKQVSFRSVGFFAHQMLRIRWVQPCGALLALSSGLVASLP